MNKSNLYFITFDGNNNVFGGYVSVKINKLNVYISYNNAFIFSLIRNGEVKNKTYPIKSDNSDEAFRLFTDFGQSGLYAFGSDIYVNLIKNCSCCKSFHYLNNNEQNRFINTTDPEYTHFEAKRVIVIQMD